MYLSAHVQALKRHNDLSDLRKKAQHHRGSTQYLTLRYMLAVTLDPVPGVPATPEAARVMRNSTGGNSTIIGAGLQQASCFLDALIKHVNCRQEAVPLTRLVSTSVWCGCCVLCRAGFLK